MFFVSQTGTLERRVRQANKGELVMATKLYVGNLPYTATNQTVEQMFTTHGEVRSAEVIMDRDTGRSKGFGFVEMRDSKGAQAAIEALNGKDVDGRQLTVNEARPREERSGSGGVRNGGRGYGGGRRY
jgi:RNA recognition motif-containing protein